MRLVELGWTDHEARGYESHRQAGRPARVCSERRGLWQLEHPGGSAVGHLNGRLRQADGDVRPVVGDWVVARGLETAGGLAVIQAVLPRRTALVRRAAGPRVEGQLLAANVDRVLCVMGLDANFRPARLVRFLAAVRESGAEPVVVLTKADLTDALDQRLAATAEVAGEAPIIALSVVTGQGLEQLDRWLTPRLTLALLGNSGVGKSTLLNCLTGEATAATGAVREADGRGRHTTTHRELFRLPGGAFLIDTPGLREFGLWEAAEGVRTTYADLETLARACRFTDCTHTGEPGCAIELALRSGQLAAARYEAWVALSREAAYRERREELGARRAEKQRWRQIHRQQRQRERPR